LLYVDVALLKGAKNMWSSQTQLIIGLAIMIIQQSAGVTVNVNQQSANVNVTISVSGGGDAIKGSGVVKTESRDVSGFASISFRGVGKVAVRQSGRESLSVTAEDNILPVLETRVENGTLVIGIKNNTSISPSKPIEYTVEVKDLQGVQLTGVGNLDGKDINVKRLSVSISGSGDVVLSGRADALELDISGSGNYRGDEFSTKQASVHCAGVANAIVNVSEHLNVNVSGVGSVEYIGSPQIQQSISGVGKVRKRR
jgi:Protein of unknown function (DUF2807).